MNENMGVYLAWQEPDTREWYVVGMLKRRSEGYVFNYTQGATFSKKFIPFSGMEELDKTYFSSELFPLFKNRLLSSRRPEYPRFIEWLGLNHDEADPIDVLGRSGAIRGTDQLQMFKRIKVDERGFFEHVFFVHGIAYMAKGSKERVDSLSLGDRLYFCLDYQNPVDKNAVIVRANDPAEILGFCPRYLSKDVYSMFGCKESDVEVFVEARSEDAPANYRLMCKMKGRVSNKVALSLMQREEYQLIGA